MLDGLLSIVSHMFGFVGGILPDSPFADLALDADNVRLGLGWLNWFVPISDMIVMLLAWIGVCVFVAGLDMALDVATGAARKVVG